jgi:CheY-like chemotaxis protein
MSPLPVMVRGDEKRLRQILINLLSNAVKYTQRGQVAFRVSRCLDKVYFEVEDSGIGIASNDLEKIFLPFQQVNDTNYYSKTEGTGLGLSITKRLVEIMSGDLRVESTLGRGSRFWVELNLPEVNTPLSNGRLLKQPMIVGYDGPCYRVLVADDKAENRTVLVNLLTSLGFEVVEACHGQECVKKALSLRPHLILMDLIMPVLDGFEATRQIRAIEGLSTVIIIAVSASAFAHDQEESKQAGCNDFIAKPFRDKTLLQKMAEYLPIKWIYEKESLIQQDVPQIELTDPVATAPSVEQATILLELSRRGDIEAMLEFIKEIERHEPRLYSFTRKILKLIERYNTKEIRKIAESYLGH